MLGFEALRKQMESKMRGKDVVNVRKNSDLWEFYQGENLIYVHHMFTGGEEYFGLPKDETDQPLPMGARLTVRNPISEQMAVLPARDFDVLPDEKGYEKGVMFLIRAIIGVL